MCILQCLHVLLFSEYLTSSDVDLRARATQLLSETLCRLTNYTLTSDEGYPLLCAPFLFHLPPSSSLHISSLSVCFLL